MHTQARSDDRQVRVFISSTFRDMHEEREELVKHIFPQLRKLCAQREVVWGEVDLRWGVTDEQSAEGKVLPICLAEIHYCRPYFIGLLGERYGWVPDSIPQELIEQEPWLAEHREHSVTELEILHGVLNNPNMAGHAFFYFRDPAWAANSSEFQENPNEHEIEQYGQEEAERRAEARRDKLIALKDRIRANNFPLREDYPDPRTLGEFVLEDLTALVNRLFPEEDKPDSLDRDAADHGAFAASRTGVYIGREEYFERLDEHISGNGPPLVILGESGSGKSALIANWAKRYRQSNQGEFLLMHFIGASPYSTDWAAMLRRIMGEFKRNLGIEQDIADKRDELRVAFANWLHMASARGKVILVLDALNQLEDRDGALDLVWLPPAIPDNVRLLLTTLPGRPLQDLSKRRWPVLHIKPLSSQERGQLIKNYLAQYSKQLSSELARRIQQAEQASNPLYLRAMLEELRIFGVHEELDARINLYLSASTVESLFSRILQQYEQDYDRDRPDLVKDTMSFVWAARRGLTEAELLDMLGTCGEPLARAHWSPLFLRAEHALVRRSGLIGFFHDYLRKAVQGRYLPSDEEQHAAHVHLADYFERQNPGPRKVDELPWQLVRAKGWDRLYHILADLTFFERLWTLSEADAKSYWFELEGNSSFHKTSCYEEALSDTEADPDALHHVATLFADTGHPERAAAIWEVLMARYSGTPFSHEVFKGAYAVALLKGGRIADGLRVLEEQARYAAVDFSLLQVQCATLGNLGMALCHIGESDRAMGLFQDQEALARRIKATASLRISVSNQATILARKQRFDEALGASLEAERLCREAGDMSGLAASLGNQGLTLLQWHRHLAAKEKLDQANEIFETLGDTSNVAKLLGARAAVLRDLNEFGEALTLLEKQERLCESSGHVLGKATACANIVTLLHRLGRSEEAMTIAQEVIQVATLNGYREVAKHMCNVVREWNDQG